MTPGSTTPTHTYSELWDDGYEISWISRNVMDNYQAAGDWDSLVVDDMAHQLIDSLMAAGKEQVRPEGGLVPLEGGQELVGNPVQPAAGQVPPAGSQQVQPEVGGGVASTAAPTSGGLVAPTAAILSATTAAATAAPADTGATVAATTPGAFAASAAPVVAPTATQLTAGALRLTDPQQAPRQRVTASTAYLTRDEFVVMDVEGTASEAVGMMQAAVQVEGLPEVAVVMPGDARPDEGEALEVLGVFDYTPSAGPNAGKKRRGLRLKASKALQSRLFCASTRKQLMKVHGLVLRDALTREGRLLRRLRQPTFRQLQTAGRWPRWYAGVEIEVLGNDGRYYLVEFGAGDPLSK